MIKTKPLYTDEFRILHSKIIEEFQWMEWTLKNIYASLIDGHYPECFDLVAEKPLGTLINKLQEVEKEYKTEFLSADDYETLRTIRDIRNYWCHSCYTKMPEQVVGSDMSITFKQIDHIKKIKEDYELTRNLQNKLVDIKIPEKVGKWRFEDFCTITDIKFIPFK